MTLDNEVMFQFELPQSVVLSLQKYVRINTPYSEMLPQQAFMQFIQDLIIQFIAKFQPTDIMLQTIHGNNPNYSMYNFVLTLDELQNIGKIIGKGCYFEEELKRKLYKIWNYYTKMEELGLIFPNS